MKFYESELPNNKLVEAAFDFSYANMMTYRPEAMKDFVRQVNESYARNLYMLEADKAAGMPEEDYNHEKTMLEKMRDEQMKVGPRAIDDELNRMFVQHRLTPAKELQKCCEAASPETLAAALLIECVRSPIDYLEIVKKFGEGVARLVAEVHHADAYPLERDAHLAKSCDETKQVYMALLVVSLDGIVERASLEAEVNPGRKIAFYEGQEETLFSSAKTLWGNDKKLDERFLAAFNGAAEVTTSPFRMEIDAATGAPELVKGSVAPPRHDPKLKPPGPGGPPKGKSGLGDDVF